MELWNLPWVNGRPASSREHLNAWMTQIGDQLNSLRVHVYILEREAGHHGRHEQYPPAYDEFTRLPLSPRQTDLENLRGWLSSIGGRIGNLSDRIDHIARARAAMLHSATPGGGAFDGVRLGDAGGGQGIS